MLVLIRQSKDTWEHLGCSQGCRLGLCRKCLNSNFKTKRGNDKKVRERANIYTLLVSSNECDTGTKFIFIDTKCQALSLPNFLLPLMLWIHWDSWSVKGEHSIMREVCSDWSRLAGRQLARLGTALSGPPHLPGSTASASSTMTATIWPRLKKRRTTCSSTGQMFIPYPLHWQGPAWLPMLVSRLNNFCNICSCTTLIFTHSWLTASPKQCLNSTEWKWWTHAFKGIDQESTSIVVTRCGGIWHFGLRNSKIS